MRVIRNRWGEVIIRRQGIKDDKKEDTKEDDKLKNKFDKTKSFSILNSTHKYTIEQLYEILSSVVDLSEKYTFDELKKKLQELS